MLVVIILLTIALGASDIAVVITIIFEITSSIRIPLFDTMTIITLAPETLFALIPIPLLLTTILLLLAMLLRRLAMGTLRLASLVAILPSASTGESSPHSPDRIIRQNKREEQTSLLII
jgi:hypothetical protein